MVTSLQHGDFNSTLFSGTASAAAADSESVCRYWELTLLLIPLLTVFGNVLVVLSVYRERSLRTVTNYFIVSLAIADIMVAILVMPLAVYVEVNNSVWGLGDNLCDAWVAFDVMFCTASILNLAAISVDRFIAVTRPISYAKHKNSKRVYVTLAVTWVVPIAVSSPIVLGINYTQKRHDTPWLCTFYNADFLIYSSMTSFYVPGLLMMLLYYKTFRAIVVRAQRKNTTKSIRQNVHPQSECITDQPEDMSLPKSKNFVFPVHIDTLSSSRTAVITTTAARSSPCSDTNSEWFETAYSDVENSEDCQNQRKEQGEEEHDLPVRAQHQCCATIKVCNNVARQTVLQDSSVEMTSFIRAKTSMYSKGTAGGETATTNCIYSESMTFGTERNMEIDSILDPSDLATAPLAFVDKIYSTQNPRCITDASKIGSLTRQKLKSPEFACKSRRHCKAVFSASLHNSTMLSFKEYKDVTTGIFLQKSRLAIKNVAKVKEKENTASEPVDKRQLNLLSDTECIPLSMNVNLQEISYQTISNMTDVNLNNTSQAEESCERRKADENSISGGTRDVSIGQHARKIRPRLRQSLRFLDSIDGAGIKTTERRRSSVVREGPVTRVSYVTKGNGSGKSVAVDAGSSSSHHGQKGRPPRGEAEVSASRDADRKERNCLSARERKATKTLAIVLGIFLLCWAPFFTLNIINAVCIRHDLFYSSFCRIHQMAFSIAVWLGYVNSFLNPVIYTIFNDDFRKGFAKLLREPTC